MKSLSEQGLTNWLHYVGGTLTGNAGDLLFGLGFRITSATAGTALAALFDQYRVEKVVVRIVPLCPAVTSTGPLLAAVDKDDSTAPASADAVCQYSDCQIFDRNKMMTIVVNQPRFPIDVAGTASAASSLPGQWADCSSAANVYWYGLKCAWTSTPNAIVMAKYTVSMLCTFRNLM